MANEASKIYPAIKDRLVGRGLDLGCGPFKLREAVIGVDEGDYDGVYNSKVLDYLKGLPDGCIDWIFSSHYFEHEPKIKEVLNECYRVLRSGGELLVYLPHCEAYVNAQGTDPNSTHVNHWTEITFVEDLARWTKFMVTGTQRRITCPFDHVFTGNGDTEDPQVQGWEYSFFVSAKSL